jgi:hypothetical protein
MPRRLSPEEDLELERLFRVLSVVGTYLDAQMGLSPEAETLAKAATCAYEARNLRGLRMMEGDISGFLQAASPTQRREMDRLLRERAGTSLAVLMEKQFAQIRRLRQRGKLTSEQQYYLVREHVEFIAEDAERAAEAAELYALLEEYESAAARRAQRGNRDRERSGTSVTD